jgi:hypothetical protein
MLVFLLWYLIVSCSAWQLSWPRFAAGFARPQLRFQPYGRAFGVGYIFWLLGTLGILGNDAGGQIFALGCCWR